MKKSLNKETIGLRIKKSRIKKNITIRELSKLTKIKEVLLYIYESELIEPDIIKIAKISIALNVSTDYIFGRVDI